MKLDKNRKGAFGKHHVPIQPETTNYKRKPNANAGGKLKAARKAALRGNNP